MSTNSKGSYQTTPQNMMAAFDKLPPTARAALANAAFNYAAQPVKTRWNRGDPGYKTGKDIATSIAAWDKRRIAKDRWKVWGIVEPTKGGATARSR